MEKEVKDLFLDFVDGGIKTYSDGKTLLKNPENKKYQGLKTIIEEIINKEIISYEYAYNMANAFIKKAPVVKRLIRKRFKFVFVDEMQDMEKNQYDLLDSLFHCDEVVFQRIGDKNQAIFSEKTAFEGVWKDRKNRLSINGSHRLSLCVAKIVNNFALDTTFRIEGRGDSNLLPCMIIFSEGSRDKVLPKFTELISKKIKREVIASSKYPIKLIGWRKQGDDGKLGITSFYPGFESKKVVTRTIHSSLKNYLSLWAASPDQEYLLNAARKSILEAFVVILRKEEIVQENGKNFSISSFLKYIRDSHENFYKEFKLNLFLWSRNVYRGKIEEALDSIKVFLPTLLEVFGREVKNSSEFINGDGPFESQLIDGKLIPRKDNIFRCPTTELEVNIGTVHSAKGETHLATLYVETFYDKKHESERLSCCFCGETKVLDRDRDRESARIAYVAMSRPTHLLCFAIHADHYEAIEDKVSGWEVVDLRE